ncbi:ankyrin repeat protein [Roseateles asaccharophilus]|uniref:hypothetical protein n=1 Tax=Roseateles asaccharophilus TaxID=582607 RepID=UPI003835DFE7
MQQFNASLWKGLIEAIRSDDGRGIDSLHASVGLSDLVLSADPEDPEARTPLMWAYWFGKPAAASAILRAGANYNQLDAHGNSARWYAERLGCGASAERMSSAIDAKVRRLSMESIIARSHKADAPQQAPEGAVSAPKGRRRRPPL